MVIAVSFYYFKTMFIQEATQPIQTDRSNTVYKKLLVIQESYGLNRFAAKPRLSIGS